MERNEKRKGVNKFEEKRKGEKEGGMNVGKNEEKEKEGKMKME